MSPDDYCRERVAPRGSTLHYCLRKLPPGQRGAITALHALYREVDDAARHVTDPGVARVKLAWWRGEIAMAYEGSPSHPVAQALTAALPAHPLARAELEAIVDGVERNVEHRPFADFAALRAHCLSTGGTVGALSAGILGHRNPGTLDCVRELGVALQLIGIIRDVGSDARAGRIFLPVDELERFGVAPADILARRAPPQFAALMQMQAARARDHCDRAIAGLPPGDRAAQAPCLAAAAIRRTLLDEIARDGFRVLDRRVALTPVRKLLIATRVLWTARSR
ncbi:MAG TPA: presqualene diphosphate synthase HpnD [Casimicrobiaceae bacterium]